MGLGIRFANLAFFPPTHTMARGAPAFDDVPTDQLAL
jgi:hypothetical protein